MDRVLREKLDAIRRTIHGGDCRCPVCRPDIHPNEHEKDAR